MMTLPPEMVATLAPLTPLFSERVWVHAQVLIWGTLLVRGPRTVTAALRAMGRSDEAHWVNFHRVLNRDVWSGLKAAQVLLRAVLALVPEGAELVVGIDDLVERRSGKTISAVGAYRDPLASSRGHDTVCFGLRWVMATAMVTLPWSRRAWALPFLTALVRPPQIQTRKSKAARTAKAAGKVYAPPPRPRLKRRVALRGRRLSTADRPRQGLRRRKTSVDIAAQILVWLSRLGLARPIVAVVDGAYCAHKLARTARRVGVVLVTRMHWDAQLFEAPEPRSRRALGARAPSPRERLEALSTGWQEVEVAWYGGRRKRLFVTSFVALWTHSKANAVPVRVVLTLDPEPERGSSPPEQCLVSTQPEASAEQIVEWFVLRWNEEVTIEEARRHLGIQTQRQSSPKAIARTTPALMGLFSLVTLMARALSANAPLKPRQAAWYPKKEATFSDCLALVRRELWRARLFPAPHPERGSEPLLPHLIEAILDGLPLTA